jgi:hypothetical protein
MQRASGSFFVSCLAICASQFLIILISIGYVFESGVTKALQEGWQENVQAMR